MNNYSKPMLLKLALVTFGAIFLVVYPLGIFWPSGWVWNAGQGSYYLQMICVIYAVLGIFLILAAQSGGAQEPDFLHCLVKRGAWRCHGDSGRHGRA
jgi:hypothetical protein